MKKFIKLLLSTLSFLVLLLALGAGAFLAFSIPIPLTGFNEAIDEQITKTLGREVSLDGKIILVSGTTPALRVENISIANPAHWPGDGNLAHLERFQTAISLRELIDRQIDIDNVTIHGLALNLEENKVGEGNWEDIGTPTQDTLPKKQAPDTETKPGNHKLNIQFTGLDFLSVSEIAVTHKVHGQTEKSLLQLNGLNGSALHNHAIRLAISGTILELPFDGSFSGGTLDELLAGADKWPFEFDLNLENASLSVKGNMAANNFSTPGALEFNLDIPDMQSLTPLTGPLPLQGGVSFSGKTLRTSFGHYQIPELNGKIADAAVSGSVEIDMTAKPPKLKGTVNVDRIDLGAIATDDDEKSKVNGETPPADTKDSKDRTLANTKSTAPKPIASPPPTILPVTGSFTLNIKQIIGLPAQARDIKLNLDVNTDDASAEVGLIFANAPFTGQLDLKRNPENGENAIKVDLDGRNADLTKLLFIFLGDKRLSGSFESADIGVIGSGSSLKDAWDKRHIDIEIANAEMNYKTEAKDWYFFMKAGSVRRQFGKPGEILANGTLSDAPYELRIPFLLPKGATFGQIQSITGKIADLQFEVIDETPKDAKPYSQLAFDLNGGNLAELDTIYELDLPPLGPYSVSGVIDVIGQNLSLEDLKVQVGESLLLANIKLDKTIKPHTLNATINAETIQLDDFEAAGWSLTEGKESTKAPLEETEKSTPVPETNTANTTDGAAAASTLPKGLLSYEVLSLLNANITLDVGEVISGPDHLGKANAILTLKDARVDLNPLTLAIPGGKVDSSLVFQPKADDTLDWNLKIDAQRADYSVLLRRIDPDTKIAGIINIDLDLAANGVPFGAPQLNVATGRLDFSVCPESLDAGILDLWATNIVLALIPKLDPDNQSKLNCVVAKLHLDDGIIFPEALGLDTSTLRMVAEGGINLKENTIDLTLTPHPKNPQILSLETPVMITGSLHEPTIEMGALPVTSTIGRMAKNIVLFPVKAIADERLPEDGRDICSCAVNYAPNPEANGALIPGEEPNLPPGPTPASKQE
ncbi:MAG: AsmA family protein [Verrucomicrobiota bacterium]